MLSELKQYLANLKASSKLDPRDESEVVKELQTHFDDEINELCQAGFSAGEAADEATKRLGEPETLGRQIYEVYSQGTWAQALLAATPHLLLAFVFAFHLWRDYHWIICMAISITGMTVYAWCRGRPSWSYSWLGYFLIPLFSVSFLVLLAVGRFLSQFIPASNMQWVVIVAYIPVAIWLLGYIIFCVIRRDWLLASFMLLPFPIIVVWLFALECGGGLLEYSTGSFQGGDQGVAWTFLALGGAAGAFIRLRRRWFKIGVLALATLLVLAMVWRFTESGINPIISALISFSLVTFLLSPVLLKGKLADRAKKIEAKDDILFKQAAGRT